MKIENILPVSKPLTGEEKPDSGQSAGFSGFLTEALSNVNQQLVGAEETTRDFVMGKNGELHQVVLATEQASMALQLTVQIRNKVIEAYQEIMRMQV